MAWDLGKSKEHTGTDDDIPGNVKDLYFQVTLHENGLGLLGKDAWLGRGVSESHVKETVLLVMEESNLNVIPVADFL